MWAAWTGWAVWMDCGDWECVWTVDCGQRGSGEGEGESERVIQSGAVLQPPTPVPVLVTVQSQSSPNQLPVQVRHRLQPSEASKTGVPCLVRCRCCEPAHASHGHDAPRSRFPVWQAACRRSQRTRSVLVRCGQSQRARTPAGAITPGLAQNVLGGISPLSRRHAPSALA